MFTGLIRELAHVKNFDGTRLCIDSKLQPNIGDSIAVNGSCLTVVQTSADFFCVEISHESKSILALENYTDTLHIEPAMKLSDRLEGHILQGHIDTTATIKEIKKSKQSVDFIFTIDKSFIKFIPPKGSIAIDGVSLTVNEVGDEWFRLTIIPHTLSNTLFMTYTINRRVNVETDLFARYLFHMFGKHKELRWSDVDSIMAMY